MNNINFNSALRRAEKSLLLNQDYNWFDNLYFKAWAKAFARELSLAGLPYKYAEYLYWNKTNIDDYKYGGIYYHEINLYLIEDLILKD
jgi:hypothetical protein